MKKLLALALVLLCASSALAADVGKMEEDRDLNLLQGPAPNGLLSRTLTVASTTIDGTGSLWWALYVPNDCKVRLMPTSAKGSYPQFTALGGTWTPRLINRKTPFVNFSGCTSGELQRQ